MAGTGEGLVLNRLKIPTDRRPTSGPCKCVGKELNQRLPVGGAQSRSPFPERRISGAIIVFVSSKRRRLEARIFAVIEGFIPL